jgi:hypothetical protein
MIITMQLSKLFIIIIIVLVNKIYWSPIITIIIINVTIYVYFTSGKDGLVIIEPTVFCRALI